MDTEGSAVGELIGVKDANAKTIPAVSSDGSRVAYEYLGEIRVMNADGSAPGPRTRPETRWRPAVPGGSR